MLRQTFWARCITAAYIVLGKIYPEYGTTAVSHNDRLFRYSRECLIFLWSTTSTTSCYKWLFCVLSKGVYDASHQIILFHSPEVRLSVVWISLARPPTHKNEWKILPSEVTSTQNSLEVVGILLRRLVILKLIIFD